MFLYNVTITAIIISTVIVWSVFHHSWAFLSSPAPSAEDLPYIHKRKQTDWTTRRAHIIKPDPIVTIVPFGSSFRAGRNKHTSWQLWMSSREGGLVTVSRPDTGVVRSLLSGGRRKHSAYSPAFITSLESSDGLSGRHKHLACALRPYRTVLPAMFAWSGHHGANGPSRPYAATWGTRLTRFQFEKAWLAPQSVHLCFS